MSKKKQGTSVEKRRRERDRERKRREKAERRRARKEDRDGDGASGAPSVEIDPETGLPEERPDEDDTGAGERGQDAGPDGEEPDRS